MTVKTKFANDVNPWRKPAEYVDEATITIADDPIDPVLPRQTKYARVFDKMKPGQCAVCEEHEVNKVHHALRFYLKERKLPGRASGVKKYKGAKPGEPTGRVWWIVDGKH